MKFAILALFILTVQLPVYAASSNSCQSSVAPAEFKKMKAWGSKVDVAYTTSITFYKETDALLSELFYKVSAYGGFECPPDKIKFKKVTSSCLLVNVLWLPGSDISGCDIHLRKNNEDLGTSHLYMNYL